MKMSLKSTRGLLAGLALATLAAVPVQAMPGGWGGHGETFLDPADVLCTIHMNPKTVSTCDEPPSRAARAVAMARAMNMGSPVSVADGRGGVEVGVVGELRDEAIKLFAQPTVDANALEALRDKQMAQHIEASKRMTAAMLEISRVLTPEQRKQMADYMLQRRDMMQRHQRERRGIDTPRS